MHSAALAVDGRIWTWGVNDEGALGRQTVGEIWETAPGRASTLFPPTLLPLLDSFMSFPGLL